MELRVSGKNMDIGESLRNFILDNLSGAVSKYYEGFVMGHVVVTKEGNGYKSEVALHLSSGVDFQSVDTNIDVYASVTGAMERIEKRLRRYKRRIKDHHHGQPLKEAIAMSYVLQAPKGFDDSANDAFDETLDSGTHDFQPVVIAEVKKPVRTMTVGQAVMECDMTGAQQLLFRNAGNNQINMVYRRSDGHFGWVDPSACEADVA